MQSIGKSLVAASILLAACNSAPKSETAENDMATKVETAENTLSFESNINPDASVVLWRGEMFGVKDHTGTVNFTQGKVVVENGEMKAGNFVVDLTTMVATDENYQPEEGYSKEKLIGHLSSPDFFNVAEFPQATFVAENGSGNSITGMLTVRGITHEETFENIQISEGKIEGDLSFDRKKYDVSFDTGAKDMVISDEITLHVTLAL